MVSYSSGSVGTHYVLENDWKSVAKFPTKLHFTVTVVPGIRHALCQYYLHIATLNSLILNALEVQSLFCLLPWLG